jgi:hypothetical protein
MLIKEKYSKTLSESSKIEETNDSFIKLLILYFSFSIVDYLGDTFILLFCLNLLNLYYPLNKNYPNFIFLFINNGKNVFNNFIKMINNSIPKYEGEEDK